MAVAGAVGMILELEKGFGALVHISPQPMRQAVKALEIEKDDRRIGDNSGSLICYGHGLRTSASDLGCNPLDGFAAGDR